MSEDIRFKISADESGAVNAFKKVRSEVLNNEHGLKSLNQEGKVTGKALKDMASVLGPEFSILGDRVGQVTGALNDARGAGLAAKAGLVGLVAVAGVQVGRMIGDWVFETQKWQDELSKAIELSSKLNQGFVKSARDRASAMSTDELMSELTGLDKALARAQSQLAGYDKAISVPFFGRTGEVEASVRILEEQIKNQRELRDVFMEAVTQRNKENSEEFKANQERIKQEMELVKQKEKAAADEQRRIELQETTLDNLALEIVRLKEGEEAYTRLSLAKQGFTQDTIDAAVAMKAEIEALKQVDKVTPDKTKEIRDNTPGSIQATQQRFITRGSGPNLEKMVADNTKQSAATLAELRKLQQDMAARSRRHFEFLERQLEGTV